MKIMRVIESKLAVIGPYSSGLYTVHAEPKMKYIVIVYELCNNYKRPQYPPMIHAIDLITDIGHEYPNWSPSLGIQSKEFKPEISLHSEIDFYGGRINSFGEIYPGKSIINSFVFYIPDDETAKGFIFREVEYLF